MTYYPQGTGGYGSGGYYDPNAYGGAAPQASYYPPAGQQSGTGGYDPNYGAGYGAAQPGPTAGGYPGDQSSYYGAPTPTYAHSPAGGYPGAPTGGYGTPPPTHSGAAPDSYGAPPPAGAYGALPTHPGAAPDSYGAPAPAGAYGVPPTHPGAAPDSYGGPPAGAYGATPTHPGAAPDSYGGLPPAGAYGGGPTPDYLQPSYGGPSASTPPPAGGGGSFSGYPGTPPPAGGYSLTATPPPAGGTSPDGYGGAYGGPGPDYLQASFGGAPPGSVPPPASASPSMYHGGPPPAVAASPSMYHGTPPPAVASSPSMYHATPPHPGGVTASPSMYHGAAPPPAGTYSSGPDHNPLAFSAPPSLSSFSSSPSSMSFSQAKRATTATRVSTATSSVASQKKVVINRDTFLTLPPFNLPPPEAPFLFEYDANIALWLISCAHLVYKKPEDCENVVKNVWEMPLFKFFNVDLTDTQAFAMANDDFIVVTFRGTESKRDWETNNDFTKVNLNSRPGFSEVKVHQGFNNALLSALPDIQTWVLEVGGKAANPHKPLYISGHSLGGALATLCYAHWTLDEVSLVVNGVVTIGQPRVGTREFVKAMNEYGPCMLQRIFNANDIVPTVPPTRMGFRHYGCPIFFARDGTLVRRPSGSKTKIDKTKAWVSGSGGVAAHKSRLYHDLIVAYHDKKMMIQGNSAVYKAVYTIHSGAYLKGADPIDAQAILTYGDVTIKTPVISSTTNPVWNHTVTLPQVYEHKQVKIEVYDVKASRFLGQLVIPLDDFTDLEHVEYQLQPRPGKRDKDISGTIFLSSNYFLISEAVVKQSAKLDVVLHNARNLFEHSGTPSPYGRIMTSTGACKTSPAAAGTRNPDWNFACSIPSVQMGEQITVEVWTKDTCLGQVRLDVHGSFEDITQKSFPLESRKGKLDRVSGQIMLSFKFTPVSTQGLPVARAHITIHGAKSIKAADRGKTSDPFVTLLVGEDSKPISTTPVIKKTLNPTWDHQVTIEKLVAGTPLTFILWDKDLLGKDFLGQVVLRLSPLSDLSRESFSLAGRAEKGDKDISGDLILSFQFEPLPSLASSSSSSSSSSSPSLASSSYPSMHPAGYGPPGGSFGSMPSYYPPS